MTQRGLTLLWPFDIFGRKMGSIWGATHWPIMELSNLVFQRVGVGSLGVWGHTKHVRNILGDHTDLVIP